MFLSTAVILFLFISSVNSGSNWYNKINIVKNGKNYINIYAFTEMELKMETLDAQNFNFTIRNGCPVNHIEFTMSTASASKMVLCIVDKNRIICKPSPLTPPYDPVAYLFSLNDENVDLYGGYNDAGLSFLNEGQKYLLQISSHFTPADDQNLCPFLMEWPPNVTLKDSHKTAEEKDVLINYEICEESEKCEGLKHESGVKFVRKGTLEFTMALLNKEKEYNILHSSGINSPIFTINASTFCSEYTTKFTFINFGSILFKRNNGKMDIETDFKPISQNVRNISISNDSDVNFYFYENFVYCNFFDPQNKFQMRILKLPEDMLKNQENSSNIQIDYKSSVKECNETMKLIVRNVKIRFPKTHTLTSTIEPSNFTMSENATIEKDDKTETASFPLGAIIAISCIGGILLLGCSALIVYCGIKKYKKRKNAKTLPKKTSEILLSISEMEKKMLSKKNPKMKSKKKNKNPEKKTEEEFSIVYGKPTESFAPINVNVKNGENEKVVQQKTVQEKIVQQKNADEKILKQKSVREKIEKMKKKYGAQQNEEEKNTTEDGEEEKVPDKIIVTKSKSKTETIDEGGATQTTQNSVQASKNSASEDSKPPNKKSKTKTRDGTAPTQASATAENPES